MNQTSHYLITVHGLFFLVSIIFSFLINRLFLKFVRTLGIRNQDDTVIRWGSQSKPAVGGFSFYIIYLLSVITYSIFFDSNQVFLSKEFIGILLATMLGFLLGLADDAYNTKPFLKFLTQVTCAVILMVTGTEITLSYVEPVNYVITIFWVVGIMNSLNMLDNMDAITTTVSISIILSALAVMAFHQEFGSVYFMILIGVMAALIGFLYFNWHPSKMYMGDTGSQFLGVFLAAIGIKYLWNAEPPSGDLISARNLLLPLIVFLMPIIDTTTVVINRLMKGQSPFVGGKDHTTHALAYLGLSDRQVAMVFWFMTLLSLLLVVIIEKYLREWTHTYTAIFSVYVVLMFALFYYAARTVKVKKEKA
ncbi:MAG: undecaprenyl/decaprenyl-phosphate alpha-N-acetylglucosaminyl 1-phosphate transferase [Bacteroidetes bacterium]|nr:undecaprenyl/decaprenyl-phosphate alpha-N-acetylglucosaminyl 1-phosphate transferase [Bacteroidota bacterium]MBP6402060.1 undecaprenyl/decaprenyl-phosphate alpha-N-acetylglucosaminyl 1-phosphate transferase [Bacteroidia bacterium]MBK9525411.1 undecaprenyl/decaprenyl-phosphate alpha-N-acetylglucosaminyl 1-phosphate transferase [Bacteroidota bacterium]MBK9542312.1 undecaprenyl/decaprenyl-phosphate alpha-N-acetylglucosaminyl 1-phosphate transferase [Bacteroidota bacterium]MBL0256231.1 undecapre